MICPKHEECTNTWCMHIEEHDKCDQCTEPQDPDNDNGIICPESCIETECNLNCEECENGNSERNN